MKGKIKTVIIIIFVLGIIIAMIISDSKKLYKNEDTPLDPKFGVSEENKINNINNIDIGVTTKTQISETGVGRKIETKILPNSIVESYKDGVHYKKMEIGYNKEGRVIFVRRPMGETPEPFINYKEYIEENQLGEPDIYDLYDTRGSYDKVYVFLNRGIMLSVHEFTEKIDFIINFEPMSREKFLLIFDDHLSEDPDPPHF